MAIEKVIVSGNQNELKSTFMLMEALYEMFTDLENNVSSGDSTDRIALPRNNHPKVVLYFLQDPTKSKGVKNKDGEISFRLMKYNYKNINLLTKQYLISLGQRIKEFLGEPVKGEEKEEFAWNKGHDLVSYGDWDNGIQFQILCAGKSSGVSVVERVLEVVEVPYHPEWLFFNQNNEPAEAYSSSPPPKLILGKEIAQPVLRPVTTVRLQRAYVLIPGMKSQLVLYDVRGRNPAALVK